MMQPKLPSLFRLPSYSQFEYRPRHYTERLGEKDKGDKRIKFNRSSFNRNPNILGQLRRQHTDSTQKSTLISSLIRIALILLFVAVCYYLAVSMGLLWKMF